MSTGLICSREVHLADPYETVQEAARRMLERGVGSLLVLDGDRHPIGIVTDRDLAVRVLATGRDPAVTTVEQVMTGRPRTFSEEVPIERALWLMRAWRVRRVPVVDRDGRLAGLLALDDVLSLIAGELSAAAQVIEKQLPPLDEALDEEADEGSRATPSAGAREAP